MLEVGSGGYGAALAAEIVGPGGRVTSVDIDDDVVRRARVCLAVAGYEECVEVVQGEGVEGVRERAPFDRILVTAAACDVPASCFEQLAPGGRLVAPLQVLHATRLVALDRIDDHLVGHDPMVCTAAPLRGAGACAAQPFLLCGGEIQLWADDDVVVDPDVLGAALDQPGTTVSTGVEVGDWDDGVDDDLALALSDPTMGVLIATQSATDGGLVAATARAGVPVLIRRESLAYRTTRPSPIRPEHHELLVVGHGPHGPALARGYADTLRSWDRGRRHRLGLRVEVWPRNADGALPSPSPHSVVLGRPSCRILVTPAASPEATRPGDPPGRRTP